MFPCILLYILGYHKIDDIYSFLDIVAGATLEQMNERLSVAFAPEKMALSVIRPQDEV